VLTFLTRGKLRLAILCAGSLFCAADAHGQDVTESSLKAAFIHNFAKFTQWPREVLPPAAPLLACVLGDTTFSDVLGSYVKGHPIDGHEIIVSHVASQEAARSCHILYVSGVTSKWAAKVVADLNGAPVLTLSDMDQFAQAGGMAQLYVEDGRIRFKVNIDSTQSSRLQFSSKLLALATLIKK
jgi:hypothetical protein